MRHPRSYVRRTYRTWTREAPDLVSFEVRIQETDLFVRLGPAAGGGGGREADVAAWRRFVEQLVREARRGLEAFLAVDPAFWTALAPRPVPPHAPRLVRRMARAAEAAGVGPMAAVAGAIAAEVGEKLREQTSEVVIENGGDLYLASRQPLTVAVFAGESPFTGLLGLRLPPEKLPTGVCTSAGTVGPSLSFGSADAAVVVAPDAALADAVATAAGNRVHSAADLQAAADWALTVPGVAGALLVKGDHLAVAGEVELVRLPAYHTRLTS
ncbi:MAG: UPF0280 family protein [Bacillota bacterium]|nr:UPF0280 family protein [Bacillota bacterium]